MAKFSRYTINQVEAQEKHVGIYVLNRAPINNVSKTRNRIILTVEKAGGGQTPIIIPPYGDLPFNVTEQAPREYIMRSSEFRQGVSEGTLQLVSPEEAEAFLSTEDAQETLAALRESEGLANNSEDGLALSADGNEGNASINPLIASTMNNAANDGESMTIVNLKRVENKSKAEYMFILERAKELGFADLEKRVKKALEKMAAKDESI